MNGCDLHPLLKILGEPQTQIVSYDCQFWYKNVEKRLELGGFFIIISNNFFIVKPKYISKTIFKKVNKTSITAN